MKGLDKLILIGVILLFACKAKNKKSYQTEVKAYLNVYQSDKQFEKQEV